MSIEWLDRRNSKTMDSAGHASGKELILSTKLYMPAVRRTLVARPRLVEKIDRVFAHKLLLISAPLGFGKTTALSAWIDAGAEGARRKVAWVSLDEADNDPVRFWTVCIAALQTLEPVVGAGALAVLKSPRPVPIESVLTLLVNEMDAVPEEFALVLEDLHVIQNPSIHTGLAFLLDHSPPRLHLIITSRADPPLPLAQLRARNELIELRAAELRFTLDEAMAFLNQVIGLGLSRDDIAALETRTEGWIAGLQLAALSMREREDRSAFITAFTGSHRYVVDYLTEQVIQLQTQEVQSFLMQTSLLDRMNASLCDAITGRKDSRIILEHLNQHNLFLIALDDNQEWFRYHHLFADVLRHRLQESQPEAIPVLHRHASEWFERAGLIPEAAHQALLAGDWEPAARLIEQITEVLWQRGEITTLSRWMQELPEPVRRHQPGLCLAYARALVDTAQFAAAETFVADAEQALASHLSGEASRQRILEGQAHALRAYLALARSEFAQAIALAHRAQEEIPSDDAGWQSFVASNLAGAYRFSSNWEAASQSYLEASALSQAAGDRVNALIALSLRGEVLQAQGQLRLAAEQYDETLQLAWNWGIAHAPLTGYALVGLGRIWCEWNELDVALRHVQKALERGREAGMLDVLLRGYLALDRIREAEGNLEGALVILDDLTPIVSRMGVTGVRDWVDARRAQIWLAQGKLEQAVDWADRYPGSADDTVYPAIPVALAHIWLARGNPDEAIRCLEHALQSAQQVGQRGNAVQLLAVKALAHRARGDPTEALADLAQALALGEPEGYCRVFVDEGAPMVRLLQRAAAREPSSKYIRQLLVALGEPAHDQEVAPVPLFEPLTEREIQVLRLIVDGATNQEIAKELVLTINTVKKHTSHIFAKLGVKNRAQAIGRARELNLR